MAVRLERELSEARADLERYRERVSQHFEKSSDLFRDLTTQYTSLYRHLAEGARDLARPGIPAFEPLPEAPRLEANRPAEAPAAPPPTVPPPAAPPPAAEAPTPPEAGEAPAAETAPRDPSGSAA